MSNDDLAHFVDRYTVEFVRHYPHPVERVWRAVTEPSELAQWFIPPSVWELKSGGAYRFEDGFRGVIEAVEPPRFIRFNFADPTEAGSYFQFELSPEADGTRLRYLQHAKPGTARPWQPPHAWDTPWGGGNLGGWHSGFEELADLLDGVPCGSRRPPTAFSAIAENWAARGEAERDTVRVSLTPEQKAQIVRELRERERWFELCDIYRAHIDATLPPSEKAI
jgi:uncharacterized protein YndB with AHSA1/START domain